MAGSPIRKTAFEIFFSSNTVAIQLNLHTLSLVFVTSIRYNGWEKPDICLVGGIYEKIL